MRNWIFLLCFEVYRAVSRQIHAIFAHYYEAYLDVSLDLRRLQTASATAKAIRARMFEEMGLTARAKLASSQRKPNCSFGLRWLSQLG